MNPLVKHEWTVAMQVLYNFSGFVANTTAYLTGLYKKSSPFSKDLQGIGR